MSTADLMHAAGYTDQPDLTPLPKIREPKIGEIVMYYQGDADAAIAANKTFDPLNSAQFRHLRGTNGTRFHPAIVTRVWSATCVNLHILLDAHPSTIRTSVSLLPDFDEDVHCTNGGWRFLDR